MLFGKKQKENRMCWSPGLVVMGGDSISECRGFESQYRILNGHFFPLICCKNCNVYFKGRKRGRDGPIKKGNIDRRIGKQQHSTLKRIVTHTKNEDNSVQMIPEKAFSLGTIPL